MVEAIHHAPVAGTLLKLLRCEEASAQHKWDFYSRLSQTGLFHQLAETIASPQLLQRTRTILFWRQ